MLFHVIFSGFFFVKRKLEQYYAEIFIITYTTLVAYEKLIISVILTNKGDSGRSLSYIKFNHSTDVFFSHWC